MTDLFRQSPLVQQLKLALGTLALSMVATFPHAARAETRNVEAFDAVIYTLPFDVEFVASSTHFVSLEGDEDTIDEIKIEVDGDTLKISKEKSWFDWSDGEIIVTVGYTVLKAITMSGSGDGFAAELSADQLNVKISGSAALELNELMCNDLVVHIAGSGDVTVNQLQADTMQTTIAGSGDVDVSGSVVAQQITVNGSGDHNARELRSQEADVKLRGSGDIEVWALANLEIHIQGSGDVSYYGEPRLKERIVGSGNINARGREP